MAHDDDPQEDIDAEIRSMFVQRDARIAALEAENAELKLTIRMSGDSCGEIVATLTARLADADAALRKAYQVVRMWEGWGTASAYRPQPVADAIDAYFAKYAAQPKDKFDV